MDGNTILSVIIGTSLGYLVVKLSERYPLRFKRDMIKEVCKIKKKG